MSDTSQLVTAIIGCRLTRNAPEEERCRESNSDTQIVFEHIVPFNWELSHQVLAIFGSESKKQYTTQEQSTELLQLSTLHEQRREERE